MGANFFFVIGIVLVLAALAIAFVGIRGSENWPPSRAVMALGTLAFAAIVGTTMAFAVAKSRDEQKKRNEKLASEEQQAEPAGGAAAANPGGQPQASSGGNTQAPEGTGAAQQIDVESPPDGSLVFDPDGLEAKPGSLTIAYKNPSAVPHSIAVATANGNVLAEVQPFASGEQQLQIPNLAPGKYVFFCTVPGHKQAGMEGDLTVTGGPTSGGQESNAPQ